MVELAAARQLLTETISHVVDANRNHGAALNSLGVEELALWEQVGAAVVPTLSAECLLAAANVVDAPELPALLEAQNSVRAAQEPTRTNLEASMLEPEELDDLSMRRMRIDKRLGVDRARFKEMRSRPGLMDFVDGMKAGVRLKPDVALLVQAYEELRVSVLATETELSRLAAVAARHHRARIRLTELDDQLAALDAGTLRDARCLVVDRGMKSSTKILAFVPALAHVLHCIEGVRAKRVVLEKICDSWVRPEKAILAAAEADGESIGTFNADSWSLNVERICGHTAVTLDAYRRAAVSVIAFCSYAAVRGDWWAALMPGVANPEQSQEAAVGPKQRYEKGESVLATARAALDAAHEPWAFTQHTVSDGDVTHIALQQGVAVPPLITEGINPVQHRQDVAANRPNPISGFENDAAGYVAEDTLELRAPTVSVAALSRPSFAPGSKVGRCIVEALIGRGGMGEVYRARLEGEEGFTRAVVLKRLTLDRDADPTLARAFAREAEIAARIAHPNVVQIFDVQSTQGEPFIIMEFLEGMTLQKLTRRAEKKQVIIDVPVIVRCALDASRGLHAAHSMRGDNGELVGLVHRDVAPDNLFLCQNGFTKLLDFGIARRNDLTSMTRKSELKGKIPFMSPEQIMGDKLDSRSDLFSLGATLYWILSGHRPFVGDNEVTTLYAVVHKPHVPMVAVRPDVGPLGDVVEQLLHKRRDDRPTSALATVKLLESCGPASPEEAAAFLTRLLEA